MSNSSRRQILERFVVKAPTATRIVITKFVPEDMKADTRNPLLQYHPGIGDSYQVVCDTVGNDEDCVLTIDPRGGGWNSKQIDLLRQLKFVPVPENESEGGPTPVLMMMRSGTGNVQLANTHWYLVNAKIDQKTINEKLHNNVTLLWEYRAPPTEEPYLKPVVTCWKWEKP